VVVRCVRETLARRAADKHLTRRWSRCTTLDAPLRFARLSWRFFLRLLQKKHTCILRPAMKGALQKVSDQTRWYHGGSTCRIVRTYQRTGGMAWIGECDYIPLSTKTKRWEECNTRADPERVWNGGDSNSSRERPPLSEAPLSLSASPFGSEIVTVEFPYVLCYSVYWVGTSWRLLVINGFSQRTMVWMPAGKEWPMKWKSSLQPSSRNPKKAIVHGTSPSLDIVWVASMRDTVLGNSWSASSSILFGPWY